MAAPQPQPAPPAAADGGTHYEEWVPPESQAAPPTAEDGEIIVGGHQRERLPEFPWPPPQASASYVLPDRLLANYHTVGDVSGAIIGALEQSGYVERSFFRQEPVASRLSPGSSGSMMTARRPPTRSAGRVAGNTPHQRRACFNSWRGYSMSIPAITG